MKLPLIIILLIINFPVYKSISKRFFPYPGDFKEAIRFFITPNFISLLNKEYWEDISSGFVLMTFLVLCAFIVFIEYFFLLAIIGIFL